MGESGLQYCKIIVLKSGESVGDGVSVSVLVTGGAGYIGSHTVLSLIDSGYSVVVLDNLSTGSRNLVPNCAPLVVGDVEDTDLVIDVIRKYDCQAVLHFAGSIIVPESVEYPIKYYCNNTVNSLKLIRCCVAEGVDNFVFSSTAAVYGNATHGIVSEQTETIPISPYGTSKLMTEWMLRDISKAENLRYACLRYFNVAGADPFGRSGQVGPQTSHLIRVGCEYLLGKRPSMSIFGNNYPTHDGTCVRDFIHVSDLANAHLLALNYLIKEQNNITLNCGYGHGVSVEEIVSVLKKFSNRELEFTYLDRRKGDPATLVANSNKIREILGWKPRYDNIEEIVSTALEWEKSQYPQSIM